MTTKALTIRADVASARRILGWIREYGEKDPLPARTRKRLLAMAESGALFKSELRRSRRFLTLMVTPSYELNRILRRLELRAIKAAS